MHVKYGLRRPSFLTHGELAELVGRVFKRVHRGVGSTPYARRLGDEAASIAHVARAANTAIARELEKRGRVASLGDAEAGRLVSWVRPADALAV